MMKDSNAQERRRKTQSDIRMLMSVPHASHHSYRERNSSDVVRLFSDAPILLGQADLRMAEEIEASGSLSIRSQATISESEHQVRILPRPGDLPPDDFEINDKGLTSTEAATRL